MSGAVEAACGGVSGRAMGVLYGGSVERLGGCTEHRAVGRAEAAVEVAAWSCGDRGAPETGASDVPGGAELGERELGRIWPCVPTSGRGST